MAARSWQSLSGKRIVVADAGARSWQTLGGPRVVEAGSAMPTLSSPTVTAIGATQATPRVTLTY